uniref:Uncharacterized protein n=1 Tax=Lepeophtheirus salmonis TaxID=72036 RepID=A0A0K2T061_LEPSM
MLKKNYDPRSERPIVEIVYKIIGILELDCHVRTVLYSKEIHINGKNE